MLYKLGIVVLILSLFIVPAAMAQSSTACSVAYGEDDAPERFSTTFSNDTGVDLMIHWVDPDCVEAQGEPFPAEGEYEFTTFDGHVFVFRDENGDVRLSYTMTSEDAGEVVSMKLAVEAYEMEQAELTCSTGGTQEEVQATILNDTDADVYMHWINFECGEGDGELIAVGEEFPFTTYDGHEFVFRDADGDELAPYVISSDISETIVPVSEIIVESADASETVEPPTCSAVEGAEHFATTFLNDTGSDVTLHFIDYVCVEMQGELIRAGEEFPFNTDDGDEFVFRDLDGELLTHYTVTTKIADEIVPISGLIAEAQVDESRIVDAIATVTGTLSENDAMNSYSFEGAVDVEYLVWLTSEDFDTYLHIYDASGEEIAYDDDSGGNLDAFVIFTAPADGIYTVGIDSFQDGASGDYVLSISHPITVISSFLAAKGPTDTAIEVEEGVTYFVFADSDEFDTVLRVLDVNSDEVVANDDRNDGSTNSFVRFTASSTGTYTVRVGGYESGDTGQFSILLGSFVAAE